MNAGTWPDLAAQERERDRRSAEAEAFWQKWERFAEVPIEEETTEEE